MIKGMYVVIPAFFVLGIIINPFADVPEKINSYHNLRGSNETLCTYYHLGQLSIAEQIDARESKRIEASDIGDCDNSDMHGYDQVREILDKRPVDQSLNFFDFKFSPETEEWNSHSEEYRSNHPPPRDKEIHSYFKWCLTKADAPNEYCVFPTEEAMAGTLKRRARWRKLGWKE